MRKLTTRVRDGQARAGPGAPGESLGTKESRTRWMVSKKLHCEIGRQTKHMTTEFGLSQFLHLAPVAGRGSQPREDGKKNLCRSATLGVLGVRISARPGSKKPAPDWLPGRLWRAKIGPIRGLNWGHPHGLVAISSAAARCVTPCRAATRAGRAGQQRLARCSMMPSGQAAPTVRHRKPRITHR